jgi:hypothetical protein
VNYNNNLMILLFNKLTMKNKFRGKIIFIYIYIYDLFVIFTLIGGIKIYLYFFEEQNTFTALENKNQIIGL